MRTAKPIFVITALAMSAAAVAASPAKARPAAATARTPRSPTQLLLKRIPSVSLAGMPLARVLKTYGKVSGLTVEADWDALEDVGVTRETPVTLKARKIRFEKLLDLTLDSIAPDDHPLSWYLSGGRVHVSTQRRVLLRNRVAVMIAPAAGTAGKVVSTQPAASPRRVINFANLALSEAIEFLREISGANFHVNWRALETVGVTRKTPVTVNARDITVARVLDLLTDQLSAGRDRYSSVYWVVRGGVVEISTGESLDRTTSIQVYEIGDLLMAVPNFEAPTIDLADTGGSTGGSQRAGLFGNDGGGNGGSGGSRGEEDIVGRRLKIRDDLVDVIRMSIGEDMWEPIGKGSVRILGGKLIVSQTPLGFKLLERSLRR